MYPRKHAKERPEKAAVVMAESGHIVTFSQLEERSVRLSRLLHEQGLRTGDTIAIFAENHPRYFEVAWAALRTGLYLTTVNRYLSLEEAAYIIDNSEAKVLVASSKLADVANGLLDRTPRVERYLMLDDAKAGFESYEEAIAKHPDVPLEDEPLGDMMLYSSGTTGRPKGVRFPLTGRKVHEGSQLIQEHWVEPYSFDTDSTFFCSAPLYHSMPVWCCVFSQSIGGTVVLMERFDPSEALRYIEEHRVTHGYFVPTMFVRMLKLSEEERARFDLSSLRVAIHGAAPCSRDVKHRMIEWWGPCLVETYGGTESSAGFYIDSKEWLEHPGSVGKVNEGHEVHILDEDGSELGPGEVGTIYFGGVTEVEYFKDPEKTSSTRNEKGWMTIGDMGYVDEQGYLYLTDRKDFMIVSGGVNIYPQEVENVLIEHPAVADAAVFGVPNPDFGEEVKAVVQVAKTVEPSAALEAEILDYCRTNIAHYKCPKSVDFESDFPRLPTGKLYKRKLRDRYWEGHATRIV